jgi:hypothetical protein
MRTRLLTPAAFGLVVLAACGSDSSGPKIGPPAQLVLATSPSASGTVQSAVGTFSVKVSDANGNAVSSVVVNFSSDRGGVVLAPASAVTDASGIAGTAITLGTKTGPVQVTAAASGVATRVIASITSKPGPLATIISTPAAIKLWEVGDTVRITSLLKDEFANNVTDFVPAFTVADPTLVSVDDVGLVKALRKGDTTTVFVSASGRSDTVSVRVAAVGESPCTDTAPASSPAIGDPTTATGSYICLTGPATASAEYTVIAYNSSSDGGTSIVGSILAHGVAAPPSTSRAPTASTLRASRAVIAEGTTPAAARPGLDETFHLRLLENARGKGNLYRASRAARDAMLSRSRPSGTGLTPSMSRADIPAGAAVGDVVSLNVSEEPCTNAIIRGFKVAAVGAKSIVLADTLNPVSGFSNADYARFAARFDTLVYPLDVGAFGAPSDIDQNTKVAILFTKYVNELTPPDAAYFVGGFFHPRDLILKTGTADDFLCATSNEGEMFYMLVPDPSGAVNGNRHSLGFVDTLTTSVLAHEFQHLINFSRRLYVLPGAFQNSEETWLNEGLSHLAEELLYYRETGIQPRQNLGDQGIRSNSAQYQLWKADAGSNFSRLLDYISDPAVASPLDPDDALATRGATWAFLRYAVDRLFPSDAGVWARFTNTQSFGLAAIDEALLTDTRPVLADFAVANYLDDLGISSDPRYTHQSWNYRDIFSNTFGSRATGVFVPLGKYPILLTGLTDNVTTFIDVRGSSAGYYRLSVPAGREALLTFASGQGAPNPLLRFIVVRTQ